MPELPEVETIKEILKTSLIGMEISRIDVYREKTILSGINEFKNSLIDKKIVDIKRKGKFLIFILTGDLALITHLRMEGKFFQYREDENDSPYAKVVFHFKNNTKLCFDDSRCFGIMKLTKASHFQDEKEIASLGQEPFHIKDVSSMFERIKNSNLPIKALLLDQSLMAGLGNIYADETLYDCKIHPLTKGKYLQKEDIENIVKSAQKILLLAIKNGGSTIKSYHPGRELDGKFQTLLKAYGKENTFCERCKHMFRFTFVNQRGTTFCPCCQIKKGLPQNIGITGKIGSGKSYVLNYFKSKGYQVYSADDIVKSLYEENKVIMTISKITSIKLIEGKLDSKALLDVFLQKPNIENKVRNYLYPLIEAFVYDKIKNNKNEIIFFEIPLLYEAHFDKYFDSIIALDIREDIQLKRLKKRNPQKAILLKELYDRRSKFDHFKYKSTYIINNDSDYKNLELSLDNILDNIRN